MFIKPFSPVGAPDESIAERDGKLVKSAGPSFVEKAVKTSAAHIEPVTAAYPRQDVSGTMAGALAAIGKGGKGLSAAKTDQSLPAPAAGAGRRTITVRSAAMPDLLGEPALRFMKMAGTERLSELYEYKLELRTADDTTVSLAVSANIDVSVLIGNEMTVSIELTGSGTGAGGGMGAGEREIGGIVVGAGFARREGRYHVYQVTLRPWLWLATLSTDFKIFQDKGVIDIIDAVLADYPYPVEKRLDAGKYTVAGKDRRNEPRAFQVQYGETDYDFIQRLMEEWGIYWFFEHSDGKHRLVLCDHVGAHKSSPSEAYRTLTYKPQNGRIDSEYISEFTPSENMRPGRVTMGDYDFTVPGNALTAVNQQPLKHSPEGAEIFLWPGDYTDSTHADLISRVRMEALRASGARASGKGNVRGLTCGQTFTLSEHAHSAANQDYLVIGSKLTCEEIGEESGSDHRYKFDNDFSVQPVTEVFRPPCITPKPRTHGPQSAIVVGPDKSEVWTDEFGRVKVRFNWDRIARAKADESKTAGGEADSCWVRVNQAWAGKGFGALFTPRVGQEVVIDFLNGDPDRPLIIGSLYNEKNASPWALPANATQSGLMSRSMEGGESNFNAIRFEDKANGEEFMIQAERDMNTTVKKNESLSVGADRSKTIAGNETVAVTGTRTETVTGDETITLNANRTKTVAIDETSSIGANRTGSVGGNETLSITGNRTMTVSGAETNAVTQTRTETTGLAKIETVGLTKVLDVGAVYAIGVTGDRSTTVGGSQTEVITGSQTSVITGNHTMTVTGFQLLDMTGDQTVQAANVVINAGTSITLVCGKSSIFMDSAGTINIEGVNITSTALETIKSSADGSHTVQGLMLLLNP